MAINLNWTPKSGSAGNTSVSVTTGTHTGNASQTKKIRFKIDDKFYKDLTVVKRAAARYLTMDKSVYSIAYNATEVTITGESNAGDITLALNSTPFSGVTVNYEFKTGSVTKNGSIELAKTDKTVSFPLGTLNNVSANSFTLKITGIPANTDTASKNINVKMAADTLGYVVTNVVQAARPAYVLNPVGSWSLPEVSWKGGTATLQGTTNATVLTFGGSTSESEFTVNISATLGSVTKSGTLVMDGAAGSLTLDFGIPFDASIRNLTVNVTFPENLSQVPIDLNGEITPGDNTAGKEEYTIPQEGRAIPYITESGSWDVYISNAANKVTLNGKTNASVIDLRQLDDKGIRNIPVKVTIGSTVKTSTLVQRLIIPVLSYFTDTEQNISIELDIPENDQQVIRPITITIYPEDNNDNIGAASVSHITQAAAPKLIVSPELLTFTWNDTTKKEVSVDSNEDWTSSITD